jgi:glycosyltransferase involved in cell wall biosynthesis
MERPDSHFSRLEFQDMSVSVVIPCYRQARFLPDALDSLRAQSRPPDRVIVVDDGSPDDVPAAVADYPEVLLIRQENRGLSAARNRGLAEARGTYVVFLDADDRLMPEALEVQARRLDEHPDAAFSWGFNLLVDTNRKPLKALGPTTFEGEPSYARLLEGNFVGAPVGVMFRRSILAASHGFSEKLRACEDVEIYLRLAHQHPIVCSYEMIGEYRVHGANMSSDRQLLYDSMIEVLALQEPLVAGDPALRAALKRGRRNLRRRFLVPARMERLGDHVRSGRWARVIIEVPGLVARHPLAFVRRLARRLRRTV